MDAVITYVNGLDPVWQASYSKAAGVPALAKRFRDWGTLKYLLRGIENCMPFIDDVFLVVASGSQVPTGPTPTTCGWCSMSKSCLQVCSLFSTVAP